ncbi:MAG: hypothetical protein WD757_06845 [Actinomycetota bacterium]
MKHNLPLGRLSPEELLVHRELEYLRVAGRRRSRRRVSDRWRKLECARKMAGAQPERTANVHR